LLKGASVAARWEGSCSPMDEFAQPDWVVGTACPKCGHIEVVKDALWEWIRRDPVGAAKEIRDRAEKRLAMKEGPQQ
jgi:hypothetical protein